MLIRQRYAIDPHGRKRLEVRRTLGWGEVIVLVDGVELGRPTRHELYDGGVEYALRDGTRLRLWLESGPNGVPFLGGTRNGHPLPGTEGDPVRMLLVALWFLWTIAAAQIALAALIFIAGTPDLVTYEIAAAGAVLALLGILAWLRSLIALVLASLMGLGEIALFTLTAGHVDVANAWRLVLALGIFGFVLWRGVRGLRDIKAHTLAVRRAPEPIHPRD